MSQITINVPPSITGLEKPLKTFFEAMVYKLHKNAHKGKWEETGFDEARRKLEQEVEELDNAMSDNNSIEIILEAADVANFAMILANIAMKEGI